MLHNNQQNNMPENVEELNLKEKIVSFAKKAGQN